MVTKLDLRRNKTMTDELTKTFFDTFEIKQREYTQCTLMGCKYVYKNCNNCQFHNIYKVDYPEINNRILLGLICILNNYGKNDTWAVSVENLKDCILMNCIKVIKEKDLKEMSLNNFKRQVRTLFEEG